MAGTAEQVAERVAQFEAAGMDLVLLQFSPQLEEMELFAKAVIGRSASLTAVGGRARLSVQGLPEADSKPAP